MFIKELNKERKHKRQRFTNEEDKLLTMYVSTLGYNWEDIAKKMHRKNKRQVRDRWLWYLNPELKAQPFTEEEDMLLEEKLNEIGNKWRVIAKFFPGRTDVSLKNRWSMIQRQRSSDSNKTQRKRKITPQSSGHVQINKEQFEFFDDADIETIEWDDPVIDAF